MKNAIPVIDISNIYKAFGENEVLKGVSLSVAKGETLVILGRSGSGKSVTIKCLVRLVTVDKGEIKVFGNNIVKLSNSELNKLRVRIGFMFQN
jgi:phospholipid/cholesterol/gamma-HCH transport system ATP-binding protein